MSFASEVKAAVKIMEQNAKDATITNITDRMSSIVDINVRDANDTGLLSNSWEASIGSVFSNEEGNGPTDGDAPEARQRIEGIRGKYKLGDTVFFTNSIEYALNNELGIGMNPRAMLRRGAKFGAKDIIK